MYEFLDRPVTQLPRRERLLLDGVRAWAFARTLGGEPEGSLRRRLPQLAETGAAQALHGAMLALDAGSSDALEIQRPCHDTVEEAEAVLLAAAALARDGRVAAAAAVLAAMVVPPCADRAALMFAEAHRRLGPVGHPVR
jgi:thioredoxin-like negative regulator of GroEL